MDSQLAFYINQLENFDPTLHEPLISVTWSRDIKLRPGISLDFESSSFTRQGFAAPGTLNNTLSGMPWISAETDAIVKIGVNSEKIVLPIRPLAREVSYSSIELRRSQQTGIPIDQQQLSALNSSYQMNTDQMVYIGSSDVGATGLINSSLVTATTVANGAISGDTEWTGKTADEIVADVNTLIQGAWQSSAYAVCPSELRLPPVQFAYVASQKVSSAGNVSILKYIEDNSISLRVNGRALNVQPVKWLAGAGVGPSDRMVVYTNDLQYVRFPMAPIQRETAYYQGIKFFAPYVWAYGEMEFVYPETLRYADGI